jgi:hypothetical protein
MGVAGLRAIQKTPWKCAWIDAQKEEENPNIEIRNPKQIQNPNHPNPKQRRFAVLGFLFW